MACLKCCSGAVNTPAIHSKARVEVRWRDHAPFIDRAASQNLEFTNFFSSLFRVFSNFSNACGDHKNSVRLLVGVRKIGVNI